MTSNLITYEWNHKLFTSQDRLNTLYLNGLINREVKPFNSYRDQYIFSTKDGKAIASFTKDISFGFCSQACGIELTNVKYL